MLEQILGRKVTWLITLGAVIIALAMGMSYLGAFLSPEENFLDFPIGIVTQDEGISVFGQSQNKGSDALEAITADDPELGDKIKWIEFDSRDELVDAMERNELYAGLAIPAGFTRDLASIARPGVVQGEPWAATIELLYNNGGGSLPGAQGKKTVQLATDQIDGQARAEVLRGLQSQGQQVEPKMVTLVANPVQVLETDVIPAGNNTGQGMGAFYIAIVATVGAFLAADVVSIGVDFVTGNTSLGRVLSKLRGPALQPTNLWEMYKAKVLLFLGTALVASGVLTWFIVPLVATPVSSTWVFFSVILLGMLAIGLLTLLMIALVGLPGILIALLATTILGVPSSFGIFPVEMLPTFYQWLGNVLPVRYLSDAVRSLVFFDGRGDAGLTRGVWVLAGYAVISLLLGGVASWWMARQRASAARISDAGKAESASVGIESRVEKLDAI